MAGGHRLIVMRHAKAADLPGAPDFDRPLRKRGERDSAAAGQWLAVSGYRPDLVLCSAARRTRQTWEVVSGALSGPPACQAERRLYDAGVHDVAELVRLTSEDVGTLMYVGHNPTASALVGLLTSTEFEAPTAAIAVIGLPGDWAGAVPGNGELLASWAPKLTR